ncbi:S1C family serine protease [Tichowtungia aerotolerans]|uniref:Trypsin-like serine protease n=1 Tax=Tichowtungia aerotolerans TaxID=2697043 RepID=A0A6P1M542_9BACT|nr:serine protease [Tichowtungia aerotolerans]QHI69909.1 trypsin-like serine protease [Tichowtungia aerotolerans]
MKRWIPAVLFCILIAGTAAAQDVREAIVKIYTVHNIPDYYNPWNMRGPQSSTGSGCIISGNRILTNGHVVRDQTFVQVRRFGESRRYQAHVLFVSHQADLALLTVDDPAFFDGIDPVPLGGLPETQQDVHVYGFPMGGDTLSITEGVISRIEHQTYSHSSLNLLAAQIDAAINPGNSGGPAIVDGQLVGVAMQGMTQADNIGYIIPVPVVQHFLKDIQNNRQDGVPDLGINWQKMENPDMRRRYGMAPGQTGMLITGIAHKSAADGVLQTGDVLLSVKGHPVADDGTVEFRPKERTLFLYYVQENQIGDHLKVEVLRNNQLLPLDIPLSHTFDDNWLIPMEQYDILPSYYIYGGVVFVPLTKNLLQMWGKNWYNNAPKELIARMSNNLRPRETDEVVLALRVLAADVNQGYQNENYWQIESVDGQKVRNLKQMISLIEAGAGNEFITFENTIGLEMVLDREKVRQEQPRILATYRIPADRSSDLQENTNVYENVFQTLEK